MTIFSKTHLIFLFVTAIFFVLGCLLVKKLSKKGQNVVFAVCAFACVAGILFRYGFGLGQRGFVLKNLLMQMLQVCNFNLILVILMLIPKCELARQYMVYFSAFAAFSMLICVPSDWHDRQWYDIYVINSWFNHAFAVALPVLMIASRRLKPKKQYIWRVTLCVFLYFTAVYAISELLIKNGLITVEKNFSFIYDPIGIPVLTWFYGIIQQPYFYLYPILPILVLFFYALYRAFKSYQGGEFINETKKSKRQRERC